ncbi:unnamed protein product [Bursaphelenchus xylophilus]|uniref:(pine wood nematode) hypothetical protein n=1 Tax=Bursaphelenchus xylophilus TaxID=6326 RepID=A0A1I7S2B5_BURXY|nr:unnamed protein product [Bursaphelenchus xylophilus]CAG9114707.1 unnamed protein product [Bursaphelenchus xylophilus]
MHLLPHILLSCLFVAISGIKIKNPWGEASCRLCLPFVDELKKGNRKSPIDVMKDICEHVTESRSREICRNTTAESLNGILTAFEKNKAATSRQVCQDAGRCHMEN